MKQHAGLLPRSEKCSARALAFFKGDSVTRHPFISSLATSDKTYAKEILSQFSADYLKTELFALPSNPSKKILCIGLGEKKKWNGRLLIKAARKLVFALKAANIKSAAVWAQDWRVASITLERSLEVFATNTELAQYEFNRYKEQPKEGWQAVDELFVVAADAGFASSLKNALLIGSTIGIYTNITRDLANTPGGDLTPIGLAMKAKELAKDAGAHVTLLGESEMEKLGMGAILGVSKGSKEEAQLIVIEYAHPLAKKRKPLVYIGKGITFDSGGLHLKPSTSMDEMHMDMSGGAAVVGAVCALAKMRLPIHVIGIVPAVENMPSGESFRPGDILISMSGKSIEVVSPDAEGRVVLADALTYAKKFSPELVIDLATLTGACPVALGHHASALLTTNERLSEKLQAIGEASGDYLWPLPMWEEYEQDIRGTVGDILNCGKNREAGTINGGMFLYQFAKDFPQWAHIDIASTMTTSSDQLLSKGASGTGTRLLIELARSLAK